MPQTSEALGRSSVVLKNPGAAITATYSSASLDLANALDNSINVILGTWTDGTFTFKLQDSPDNNTWTDVAAGLYNGSLGVVSDNTQVGTALRVGYLGAQRYVKVVCTVTGSPATGLFHAIEAVVKYRRHS